MRCAAMNSPPTGAFSSGAVERKRAEIAERVEYLDETVSRRSDTEPVAAEMRRNCGDDRTGRHPAAAIEAAAPGRAACIWCLCR
jgi:hypothetical protein